MCYVLFLWECFVHLLIPFFLSTVWINDQDQQVLFAMYSTVSLSLSLEGMNPIRLLETPKRNKPSHSLGKALVSCQKKTVYWFCSMSPTINAHQKQYRPISSMVDESFLAKKSKLSNSKSATPQFIAAKQTAEPLNRPNSPPVTVSTYKADPVTKSMRQSDIHMSTRFKRGTFLHANVKRRSDKYSVWVFTGLCKVNILKTLEVITTKYPWPGKRLNQHEKRKD